MLHRTTFAVTQACENILEMSLYKALQQAKSEEDVKDAYIKALGLKSYTKGLIDIQTNEVWFEAKMTGKTSTYAMFTQLLHYVQVALNKGETVPPLLAVIDTEKAALMKSADVLPFLAKKTIKWGKSASQYPQQALDEISAHIGTHFVSFRIETHEQEFISTTRNAIKSGDIIRTQITPDNLKQVFDKWVAMIGRELAGVKPDQYALLFFADVMHDGTVSTHANLPAELLHKNGSPVFSLGGQLFELGNKEGYRQFWAIYHKPPNSEYRDYLLERRDSLIPLDERSFKGAFYTPLHVVDKAYDKLSETLGKNWQKDYLVWDMCCGVGNLEVKHSNHRNIFMSTLDQADVDVMKATKTCVAAHRFQYDYLNDDIRQDGTIDYSLTGKLPQALRDAIALKKKILVLINPPYAAATNRGNTANIGESTSKAGVKRTKFAEYAMGDYGKASNELFTQFLARIAKEIPQATVALFSTLKYVSAPDFAQFRALWTAKYLGGFVVHNKAFDGLTGNFPIGFLIWKTGPSQPRIGEIEAEVLNKNAEAIGAKKFFNIPNQEHLSTWIVRPKADGPDAVPLKNAVTPATATKDLRGTRWAKGAIGSMDVAGNDLQHAEQHTVLYSSGYGSAGAFFVTPENLLQAAVVFSVRRLVRPTWLNDRDQFTKPTEPLSEKFQMECLIWMLFHRCNRTAGADGIEWGGRTWSLTNHFIPFSEDEVGAPERFESDFMASFLSGRALSQEACAVLDHGRTLWKAYFSAVDPFTVRQTLKLNRPDAGWYQIRKALALRNESGNYPPVNFTAFEEAYEALTDKLQPCVFSLGFLRQ